MENFKPQHSHVVEIPESVYKLLEIPRDLNEIVM